MNLLIHFPMKINKVTAGQWSLIIIAAILTAKKDSIYDQGSTVSRLQIH